MPLANSWYWVAIAVIALILLGIGVAEADVAEDLTHVGSLVILAVTVVRAWRRWDSYRPVSA